MTRLRLASIVALGLVLGSGLAARAEDAPAGAGVAWSDDLAASLKKAEAEKKDVLMDFTGSDWCGWCMKLKSEVFDQAQFKKAEAKFVFVEVDFPNAKPQSDAVKAQNKALQQKFGIQGFPTIVLADAQGRPFGQTGYQPGGPEKYAAMLDGLRELRIARDVQFAAAEKAKGVEKARLLDAGLQALKNDELVLKFYGPVVEQIEKLDTEGKVKERYVKMHQSIEEARNFKMSMQSILNKAKVKADPDGTIKKLQALAAKEALPNEFKQQALLVASRVCQLELKDNARAEPLFDAAIAVDPDSDMGRKLKENKAKFYPKEGAEKPVVPGTN